MFCLRRRIFKLDLLWSRSVSYMYNIYFLKTHQIFLIFILQRCSPPTLLLSLSPGLGPDGLPSPGGYFPHSTNGSGPGGNITGSNSMNNAVAVNTAAAAAISFGAGIQNSSCNNPSPLGSVMGTQNSHRSSPCNELLAAAMRTSATNGESTVAQSLHSNRICSIVL